MRNLLVAAVLAAALVPAVAAAQPALTPPIATQPDQVPEVKSESGATALAIATTIAGGAAIYGAGQTRNDSLAWLGVGLVLAGPSAGHLYAGEYGHAAKMTALRAGGMLVFGVGLIASMSVAYEADCAGPCSGGSSSSHGPGTALMLLGGGTVLASTIYDLYDAHRSAHRANVRAAQQHWMVAPTVLGTRDGTAPGLAFAGAF